MTFETTGFDRCDTFANQGLWRWRTRWLKSAVQLGLWYQRHQALACIGQSCRWLHSNSLRTGKMWENDRKCYQVQNLKLKNLIFTHFYQASCMNGSTTFGHVAWQSLAKDRGETPSGETKWIKMKERTNLKGFVWKMLECWKHPSWER